MKEIVNSKNSAKEMVDACKSNDNYENVISTYKKQFGDFTLCIIHHALIEILALIVDEHLNTPMHKILMDLHPENRDYCLASDDIDTAIVKRLISEIKLAKKTNFASLYQDGTEQRITLEFNIDQAYSIESALELYNRIGMGQLDYLIDVFNEGIIPIGSKPGARTLPNQDILDDIENRLKEIKVGLGYRSHGNCGIGHPHLHVKAARAYEVNKVVRKAISVVKDIRGTHFSDGLMVRYTRDPAPSFKLSGSL
jgi:hypothetical protein